MANAGGVFYSILPIKGAHAEVETMIDLISNTTTYPLTNAYSGHLVYDKLFIDGKTLLPKKDPISGLKLVSYIPKMRVKIVN